MAQKRGPVGRNAGQQKAKQTAAQRRLASGSPAEKALALARAKLSAAKRRNTQTPTSASKKALDDARKKFLAAKNKVG